MKYIILLTTLVFCICHAIFAQHTYQYPDSIRIEVPDQHTLVVFQFRSVDQIKPVMDIFAGQFKSLLHHIENSTSNDFSQTGPYTIDIAISAETSFDKIDLGQEGELKGVGEQLKITICKELKKTTDVLVKDNRIVQLLPPGWKVNITSKFYKVSIYAETFEELTKVAGMNFTDAGTVVKEDERTKSVGRKSIYARMSYSDNRFKKNVIKLNHPGDNIFLTAIGGVGIVRDKIYPELSFKLGLTFNDHFSRRNIRTSLLYNNLFMTEKVEGKYSTFSNSFLSLQFEHNFNPRNDAPHWTGFGVGVLTQKRGGYFTGNTMKFFITHEIGSKVNVVPEFYLTNDLTKFVFGTTLRYSF